MPIVLFGDDIYLLLSYQRIIFEHSWLVMGFLDYFWKYFENIYGRKLPKLWKITFLDFLNSKNKIKHLIQFIENVLCTPKIYFPSIIKNSFPFLQKFYISLYIILIIIFNTILEIQKDFPINEISHNPFKYDIYTPAEEWAS